MAQTEVRVNLTAKQFPFKFDELSNTVIVNRGFEQHRQFLPGFDGQEPVQSYGLCQAFYMENVLPQVRGYSSVHAKAELAAVPPAYYGSALKDSYILRDEANNVALYSPADGMNYVFDADLGEWRSYPFPGILSGNVTVAYLKGVTYICYAGVGLFTYNFYTRAMEAVVLAGINAQAVRGVSAANQYLLLWDANTVYWSSATEPRDFVPDLGTGAGSTGVLAVRSPITTVLPIADGFVCYTTTNAIGTAFSGDARNPWIFREIPGSAGVAIPEHVTYEANLEAHFAWTTSGMQQVSLRRAEPIWPELTDSIARGMYSEIVAPAEVPTVRKFPALTVRMGTVGARYVTISLRDSAVTTQFPMAYVYDLSLERWGRVDIPHVDIMEYRAPEFAQITSYNSLLDTGETYDDLLLTSYESLGIPLESSTARFGESFGVVQADGKVYSMRLGDALAPEVNWTIDHAAAGAKTPNIFHGRYKLARPNGVELQQIQLTRGAGLALRAVLHDTAGDIIRDQAITSDQHAEVYGDYLCRVAADSVSLKIAGKFTLTDLLLRMRGHGTRNQPRRIIP